MILGFYYAVYSLIFPNKPLGLSYKQVMSDGKLLQWILFRGIRVKGMNTNEHHTFFI